MAGIDELYIRQLLDHEEIKGNYDIKEYIGKGDFGYVCKAVHYLEEKECALKLIRIEQGVFESRDDKNTEEIDKILEHKKEVLSMVNLWETMPYCENVVKYYHSCKLTGLDIVVIKMELCDQSLLSYLKSQTAQNSVFDDIAFGLINGLDYIHKKILCHGDIKSDNIFMVGDVPKIGDFGNASLKKRSNGRDSVGMQGDDLKEMGIVLVEVYVPDAVFFKELEDDKKMKRLSTWKKSRFVEDTKLSRNFVAALIEDLYNNRITASAAFRRISDELKIKGDNQDGKLATSVDKMAGIDEPYIRQSLDHEEIKGNYDIKEYIGKGDFGYVCKAVHYLEEKECALKLIRIEQGVFESRDDKNTEEIDKILEHKKEVLSMVNLWEKMPYCENVVKYYHSCKLTGLDIVVIKMELCDQSLLSYLKSQTAQNSVFDDIAFGLINGLDYIHKKILCHGDIKSDNIFMVGDVPKIGDFGNASLKKRSNGRDSVGMQVDDLKEMGIVLVEVYVPGAVFFKELEDDKKMKCLSPWKESGFVEDTKLSRNFVAALIEDLYNNRITASAAFRRISDELKIKEDNQDGKLATSFGMVDSLGNLNLHDKASPTTMIKVTPKKVDELKCSLWNSVGKLYFTDTARVRRTQIVIAVGNRFVITAYASCARHEMEVHFDQSKYLVVDNRYCYPKVNHQIMLLEVGRSRVSPIPVRDFIEPQECAEFFVFGLNGDGEYASCESKLLPEQSKDDSIIFESDIQMMGSPLLLGVPKDHKRPEVVAMLTSSYQNTSNENLAPGHMSFKVREGTIVNRMLKEILSEDPELYKELSLAD